MQLINKFFVSLLLFIPFGLAYGLEKEDFSQARFDELSANGEVILVDIFAPWCPVCARQREILEEFQASNPDNELYILEVDFDNDKDIVSQFRAPRQSTLILYRGTEQVWFSVAETDQEMITDTLLSALNTAGR